MKLQVDGREVYAYTGGKPFDRGAADCSCFVHGALNDHSVWTLLARWFAHHGWSVLAPDLPGHMRSAGPALRTVEAMADWLLALLDAAGVQRAALGRPQPGLAGRARSGRARAGARHAPRDAGHRVPMPVPQALLDAGAQRRPCRDRPRRHVLVLDPGRQAVVPRPGRVAARRRRAADAPGDRAAGADPLLFHTDFDACNAYARRAGRPPRA